MLRPRFSVRGDLGVDGVLVVPNVLKIWAGSRASKCGKIVTDPQNMSHINKIEGIGPSHTKKFAEVGVTTVEHLLKAGQLRKAGRNWQLRPVFTSITY